MSEFPRYFKTNIGWPMRFDDDGAGIWIDCNCVSSLYNLASAIHLSKTEADCGWKEITAAEAAEILKEKL